MVALKKARAKKPAITAITVDDVMEAMPASRLVSYAPTEIIFREGSLAKDCYLILKGKVEVQKKIQDGGELALATVTAGEFLGEMAMISGERRSASAMASTRVEAVVIRKVAFEALLKVKHPFVARLSLQFSALLASRCQQLLGLIAQQEKKAAPRGKKSKSLLDVRTVFNRVYTLWAV